MPDGKTYGFDRQGEYETYLYKQRKLPQKRVGDYVSLLNTVSRILGDRIKSTMVASKSQIDDIVKKLQGAGRLTDGTISNCKTALCHYCRALNRHKPQ
ncbi:MAG: hypothetical protein ACR2PV_06665 [Gammaproteobacteria bacterium]